MSDFTELRKRWIEAEKQQRDWREAGEESLLWDLNNAINGLVSLGWRRALSAPRDGTHFLVIEAGSTGVFPCSWRENSLRPEGGCFWIEASGDLWSATPLLWKPMPCQQK